MSSNTNTNTNANIKIAIVMWYDENIRSYGDVNYLINKQYCQKHGYDIIQSNKRLYADNERTPHWERIPLMLKCLTNIDRKYDYLVWIDADAHFYIDAYPVTSIIEKYPNKSLILSGDYPHLNTSWEINSGVFILKNNKECFDILMAWGYSDILEKVAKKNIHKYGNYKDQKVLRLMYDNNILNIKQKSVVIPYGIFQHFFPKSKKELMQRPLICHLAGSDTMTRIQHSTDYYMKAMSTGAPKIEI